MGKLGFAGGKLTFIAILEIIGAAGFILSRTRSIGLLWGVVVSWPRDLRARAGGRIR